MAKDNDDWISRRDGSAPINPTQNLPLQGSAGWPARQRELEIKGTALGLSPQIIEHLGRIYGSEAMELLKLIEGDAELGRHLIDNLPYTRSELVYAFRQEMRITPNDLLARRTSLTMAASNGGFG